MLDAEEAQSRENVHERLLEVMRLLEKQKLHETSWPDESMPRDAVLETLVMGAAGMGMRIEHADQVPVRFGLK